MNGLLPAADLKTIAQKAVDWGLADAREALFAAFDQGTRAHIMVLPSPNDTSASLLRRDLDKLNSLTGQTAEGVLVLAVWLDACAAEVAVQASRAKFFSDWAVKVRDLPIVPLADSARDVETIAGALDDKGTVAAPVTQLADDLDGYINKLATHAELLVRAKRLHDSLHSLQIGALPMLRQAAAMGPAIATYAALAASPLTIIGTAATGLAAEVDPLDAGSPLKGLGETLAAALKASVIAGSNAVAEIRVAASADPSDPAAMTARLTDFTKAVGDIRSQIKDSMSTLETEIHQRIGQMQPGQPLALDQLAAALTRLAKDSDDPELSEAASRAVQSLTIIGIDLSAIDDHHHDWQQVDSQLWLLELLFDRLAEGRDDGMVFASVWPGVIRQIEKFSGSPKPEWALRIDSLIAKFQLDCPQPPTVPLRPGASESFGAVIGEIRQEFRQVDINLKKSCERLGAITAQLARL